MSTFLSAFLFSNFPLKKPAHYALPVTVSVFPRPTFQSLPHSSHIKQSKCHRNHRDLPTSWIPISIILFFPEAVVKYHNTAPQRRSLFQLTVSFAGHQSRWQELTTQLQSRAEGETHTFLYSSPLVPRPKSGNGAAHCRLDLPTSTINHPVSIHIMSLLSQSYKYTSALLEVDGSNQCKKKNYRKNAFLLNPLFVSVLSNQTHTLQRFLFILSSMQMCARWSFSFLRMFSNSYTLQHLF